MDQQSLMCLALYQRYLTERETVPFDGEEMPYDWGQLPKSIRIDWLVYGQMFDEFAREIANDLNTLTNYTHRLKVWNAVISSLSQEKKMEALHEFIAPIATVSLTYPYVIKQRFIFATAHLCHQANRFRLGEQWKDDLRRDREIEFKDANKHGEPWNEYERLKEAIRNISDQRFQEATEDFRHRYTHRFSPHVGLGLTGFVARQIDRETKRVKYVLGAKQPLELSSAADLLIDQCKRGYAAFDAFQSLVREHEALYRK
jgi:hypothetical protein